MGLANSLLARKQPPKLEPKQGMGTWQASHQIQGDESCQGGPKIGRKKEVSMRSIDEWIDRVDGIALRLNAKYQGNVRTPDANMKQDFAKSRY